MTLSDNLAKFCNAIELTNENKHPLILGDRRYILSSFQQQYCVEQTVYHRSSSKLLNILTTQKRIYVNSMPSNEIRFLS